MNGLHLPTNSGGIAYIDKWLTLTDIGSIVATYYNRVVVQLISSKRGLSESFFFPIRGAPTLSPLAYIMCLGLILCHFLHVYMKDSCQLPPYRTEWKNHKIDKVE